MADSTSVIKLELWDKQSTVESWRAAYDSLATSFPALRLEGVQAW